MLDICNLVEGSVSGPFASNMMGISAVNLSFAESGDHSLGSIHGTPASAAAVMSFASLLWIDERPLIVIMRASWPRRAATRLSCCS